MKRETCTHLVWVPLFLLIRGYYPENRTQTGRDIPKFLKTNCHMNISPASLAQHIMRVDWTSIPVTMRNRFGQGIARYRYLGPFRILRPQIVRPAEVIVTYQSLKVILDREPDWALSRKQVARRHLGSFN
jgi:hypothetical protein